MSLLVITYLLVLIVRIALTILSGIHHISQRELARITGKRPSEVTRWLSGQHNFTLATLARLSVALNHDFVVVR